MTLFDKLFGSSEERAARAILRRVDAEVKAIYGPLGRLTEAIVRAADGAWRASGAALGFTFQGTPSEQQILVLYELLYFFCHLANRSAFTARFTDAQIARMQRYIAPVVSATAVSMFFNHWPDEGKHKIRSEFYDHLNDAEMQYAECRGLLSRENPLDPNTLMGRLAANVAELCNKPGDPFVMMAVVVAGTESYTGMHLEDLMADVHAVIDSATDDVPPDVPSV